MISVSQLAPTPKIYSVSICELTALTDDVVLAKLKLEDPNYSFQAGQYVEIVVDDEPRPFSIASSPQQLPFLEFHIRKQPDNPFTCNLLEKMALKQPLHITHAHGYCHYPEKFSHDSDKEWVFITGGTGFAPANAIIHTLYDDHPEITCHLFWGVGQSSDLYAQKPLQQLQQQQANFYYHPVVFDPHAQWMGLTGLVHRAAMETLSKDLSEYEYLLAGSLEMVSAVYEDLSSSGVERSHIHGDMIDIMRDQGDLV